MEPKLTVHDVLDLIAGRAQRCREDGDTDMRNILNTVRSIKFMIEQGKSRDDIIEAWSYDDE
jgi:hypothetical protein